MKRDELDRYLASSPDIQELRRTAKMLGLKLKRRMKKRDIIKLLKTYGERLTATSYMENTETKKITSQPLDTNLPKSYGKDRLVLLPVNPKYVFSYWDFSADTLSRFASIESKPFLHLYDVTNVFFDGSNANITKEITIDLDTGSWYFKVDFSGAAYLAEIGYYEEKFIPVIRSNIIRVPRDFPKFETEEKWLDIKNKKITSEKSVYLDDEGKALNEVVEKNPSSEEYLVSLSKSISGGRWL